MAPSHKAVIGQSAMTLAMLVTLKLLYSGYFNVHAGFKEP